MVAFLTNEIAHYSIVLNFIIDEGFYAIKI